MSEPENTQAPKIKTRLLTSMISAGQIGKTTIFMQGVIPWLEFASIDWLAVDCDGEHHTLSDTLEASVFHPVADPDDFVTLFEENALVPVEIIDFPAQHTSFYVKLFQRLRILESLNAKGVRITLFLFATDLSAATHSAALMVEVFGDQVDYVIVENPARSKFNSFYRTVLAQQLKELGAKTIELPALLQLTLNEIRIKSKEAERFFSFNEAKPSLSHLAKNDIEYFQNRIAAQLEDIADLIVPDTALIKKKIVRIKPPESINTPKSRLLGAL